MKFAVISDIHGNMQALNAVLADVSTQKCDEILCLGDLALAGPSPSETVEFVKTQSWRIIQGNTDFLIANYSKKLRDEVGALYPAMGAALWADYSVMEKDLISYLGKLPPSVGFLVDGVKILMVHGSPRANNENIYPDMELAAVEEIMKDTDCDLLLCGHTHSPCGYQTMKGQTVVNVGSVGRSMLPDARAGYAIIDLTMGETLVEHRFVSYDNRVAADLLAKRGYNGAQDIAKMLILPTSRHV